MCEHVSHRGRPTCSEDVGSRLEEATEVHTVAGRMGRSRALIYSGFKQTVATVGWQARSSMLQSRGTWGFRDLRAPRVQWEKGRLGQFYGADGQCLFVLLSRPQPLSCFREPGLGLQHCPEIL